MKNNMHKSLITQNGVDRNLKALLRKAHELRREGCPPEKADASVSTWKTRPTPAT